MEVMMAVVANDWKEHGDGTLDIWGISTGLRVTAVPYVEPFMNLIINFSATQAEVETERLIEVHLLDADGNRVYSRWTTQLVPKPKRPGSRPDFNLVFPLRNVPFPVDGDYAFHILVGEDDKRTVPFYISVEEES